MKREELLKVYGYAKSIWSSFKVSNVEPDASLHDEVWFEVLKPYDVRVVLTAMQEYAKESDFCNISKVACLCEKILNIKNGSYIDVESVLSEIRNAVSYAYCKEKFATLSEFAKSIVEHPARLAQWANSESLDTVIMSNLRKTITNKLEQRKLQKQIDNVLIENASLSYMANGKKKHEEE